MECLLPHHMTYSTTSQTGHLCQQRSRRLSGPSCPFRRQLRSRGLGACAGLLASCPCVLFHSFIGPHHSASDCRSEAAHQGLKGVLSPQGCWVRLGFEQVTRAAENGSDSIAATCRKHMEQGTSPRQRTCPCRGSSSWNSY